MISRFLTHLAKFNPENENKTKWLFYPVKLLLGLLLVQLQKVCWSNFFTKSQKLWFGHFLAHLAKIGQNDNFYKKSGHAIFLPLLSPNFMPSFRKILDAVSEINSLQKSGRTNWRMDKGDITEPVAFAGSIWLKYA